MRSTQSKDLSCLGELRRRITSELATIHSQSQLPTHSMHPSAVILTLSIAKRKDLHLFFRHSSDPMPCGNQQVRSRTDRDSNPSTPGSSIRSAQSSLRVSSPSVPSPAQSLSGCTKT